ncbi:MAG: trigger factor [Christensenellales bacterium]|jgi:trigger factor
MTSTIEKLSSNQVKINFAVDAALFEKGIDAAYRKLVKKVNIPGFRKGKAPRKVIEMQYGGKAVFYDDALNEIFPEVYSAAIAEHKLEPVDSPSLVATDFKDDGSLDFSMTVYVKPDVTLGKYIGIELTKDVEEITEDDVSAEIERARERVSRFENVIDRPAKLDDRANIDYAGTVDGVAFEGGTAEKQDLVLGSGSFIPGFEDQVVGMNIGEEKDINVTFPEEYHAPELAGKEAVFHVKLHSLQEKELPALDDAFAQDVSDCDTLEEYRDQVRERLVKNAEDAADARFENQLLEILTESSEVDIPEAMIDEEIDGQIRDFETRMLYQGLKMADYLKYTGQTEEQMRAQIRPGAEDRVKMRLVLEAVIKAEGVEPTDEDIENEIEEYAKSAGQDGDSFRKNLSDTGRAYLKDIATTKKAIRFLKDSAVIVDHMEEDDSELFVDAE